mgnify:CR=1 FL=1
MARKMKDSGIEWIGEIPEGWEIRKIKNNFMIYAGATPKSEKAEYWDGGIPWITPADFKTTDKYVSYGRKSLTALGYDSCGTTLVPAGSIIFSKRAPVGSVVIAKNTLCTNQGCLACIPNDAVNSTYFYYCMSIFTEQFELVSAGTTFKEIAASTFASFLLPCPPLSQQNEIVNFLDKESSRIDSMLSKTRSSIEEYKKLKQAVITQAVTKGVRGEREMKDSGVEWIGEIPKEWVCEKIKYATSISRGLFNHRPRNDERYYNGKYPFIQTGDVANATKYIVSYSQTLNELGKAVSKEFPKGTLTMTIAANVGDVAILNFDAYFPDSIVGFIPNKNIRTLYLFYVFSAMKDEFTRTAIKSTQLNLNIDRVKETFIPVTLNVNEQCEIENYLESKCAEINGLIAKKEQLVKELESYKKSLIYEVVTGKREV